MIFDTPATQLMLKTDKIDQTKKLKPLTDGRFKFRGLTTTTTSASLPFGRSWPFSYYWPYIRYNYTIKGSCGWRKPTAEASRKKHGSSG
jgi:hypothetical protein